ncbi:unnamed protein product [Closterium sp. NIES-53]
MTPNPDNPVPRAQQLAEILQAARTRAADAIKKSNIIAKRNANRHYQPIAYQPDDLVLLNTQNLRLPISPKLRPDIVSASRLVAPPCSCRLMSHQTLLWHHRLGHPSLPRLRGMHSASLSLVFLGLCLPSRPCLPRPTFLASRDGSAPLLTPPLFPRRLLPCKLSTWTCGAWPASLDRAASASFCWLLTITRRRIGLVMEVARTSMIHAAAPHFLWPFAVWYAAHQLNLWPRVSLPETSPTLCWTVEVGDASVFRVWGSRAFVRDTSADKLSALAVLCVFLGFPPDAPG